MRRSKAPVLAAKFWRESCCGPCWPIFIGGVLAEPKKQSNSDPFHETSKLGFTGCFFKPSVQPMVTMVDTYLQ